MIASVVARYATRFHRILADESPVASPLGAWLLLALVAPSARGAARTALVDVLGCEPEVAFASAVELIADPHAEVVLGAAAWHDSHYETPQLLDLLRRLAATADGGPIPSQLEADEWARTRTLGLIDRFPIEIEGDDPLVVLLATALASKVEWEQAFEVVPADHAALVAHPGFAGHPLLRKPERTFWAGFVDTAAGTVAGHVARSTRGLLVVSAVGDASADPAALLDAAQQIGVDLASGRAPRRRSLFDLPLGAGPAWHIAEEVTSSDDGRERIQCLLPAWEVQGEHDLMATADLGFPAAGDALIELLPPDDNYRAEARQSSMARYGAAGFEAAAVTALGARVVSFSVPREEPVRVARVEYTRPHAVVAVTEAAQGAWQGVPVFSAWVSGGVAP